jgi:multidrug efflux pump subunit AcrA (membrane-fusion protein)
MLAGVLDGLGNLHLGVAGCVEDQRQHQHAARRLRRGKQAVVQRRRGELDEADLDAPGRLARAPLADKVADFLVAGVLARATGPS